MPYTRREFLHLAAGGVAASAWLSPLAAPAAPPPRFQAIAFDAFPILDPRPVFALAEQLFPGKGAELSNAWRTRQFEYQWLRALAGQYVDFWQATDDALAFAATLLHLDLTPATRQQLMAAYLRLQAWPEVPQALQALKRAGLRLAFLSNATPQILHAGIKNSELEEVFDQVLSTDQLHTYKPDPRAYQMAIDALQLQREDILFVAFAGWDVAGAKWFGYPTFWVNRLQLPGEALGVAPDAMGRDLTEVVRFVHAPW
jgi:2-haloacid dehalogenase